MVSLHHHHIPDMELSAFFDKTINVEDNRLIYLKYFLFIKYKENIYVEVKSVTLGLGKGLGAFPDAVTTRGLKHLRELLEMKKAGHRAALLFCVQHEGIQEVRPADEIDPAYGALLREVQRKGVEVLAYRADIDAQEIRLSTQVPVLF